MPSALVLFAHGARDPAWAEPFRRLRARLVEADPARDVEIAFLEFLEPDLPEACRRLAGRGAARIVVVPVFLGTGGHLRRDFPPLVEAARAALPGVEIVPTGAIGELDAVVAALADAIAGVTAALD